MERPAWHTDDFPELRSAPPWVMREMIEAQPEVVESIATGADTAPLALLLRVPGPLTVVGCGTSEHAALATAEILTEAGTEAGSRQAFEAALAPQQGGAVVGISHEGGTWATVEALEAARRAGSATGLITAMADSRATSEADGVVVTPLVDRSWCHTVGYTSPIATALAIAARPEPGAAGALVAAGVERRTAAAEVAAALAGCAHLIVIGSGADRIAARELTLKIEEASHIPTAMRDLETFLHGHLPACDERTGLLLIEHDRRRGGPRHERGETLLRAAARVGVRCAVIGRTAPHAELAPAGYVATPSDDRLPAAAEALLATAPALQWIAYELAVARDVNPDLIRREQEPYREAAALHG
ncbi:MAG TPA: SIS domain-containing protein [Gaiellales bacterium]|nr:SIS domain-containing protein [Gaiellales bacterium]